MKVILKTAIWCFILMVATTNVSAQFGLRLKYNQNNFNNWGDAFNERFGTDEKILSSGYEVGLDYWFRLKKRRVEFMPEISYSTSKTTFVNPTFNSINATGFSFNFNTQIYALDMEGDCNCPTFSKQGAGINKGLFFHLTPGFMYQKADVEMNPISSFIFEENKNTDIVMKMGVGVGIDFGLSDLLTITPIISYYFYSGMNWQELRVTGDPEVFSDVKQNLRQLQLTLRLGFRPDYRKTSFRR